MQSPRSSETSPPERPRVPAAAARFRARLEQASETLLSRIRHRLRNTGLHHGPALDDHARDVFQEAILEALRSEHTYDPDRDLRFWLLGIAMNVVRRHVERVRQARRRLHPEPPADDEAVEALHEQLRRAGSRLQSGPEEAMALREEAEGVLADLPEQHREVLRLYYFEHDNDHEAVAAALGITPGAARTRLCRALQAARKGSSR